MSPKQVENTVFLRINTEQVSRMLEMIIICRQLGIPRSKGK